ncbi:hypothetical protein BGZ72_005240 [Mortierella alpina]|nr:hypothetical protein BGZ72_005240 [Mortierella alpina]
MPMFWNHNQQPGNKKKTRNQENELTDSRPAAADNVFGEEAESSRQRATDGASSKIRRVKSSPPLKPSHKNLRDPREAPQPQRHQHGETPLKSAKQREQPSPLRKVAKVGNKTLNKSSARARIGDGISTIKTMFDGVFGTDTPALGLVPDSILQEATPVPKEREALSLATLEKDETSSAPELCQAPTSSSPSSPCSVGGTDASETLQKALHELEHALETAVAAAAVAKDINPENDSSADHSSSKKKKSVIIVNDYEYEYAHEHEQADDLSYNSGSDESIADQAPYMEPAPASGPQSLDSESEEFILPFLHYPSTRAFDFPGSDLLFAGTALQRILASFALVILGLFVFLLVISYKMHVRRRTASSPLAFLQYMTKGVLFSPFAASPMATSSDRSWTRRSPGFVKSPSSLLGRSGSGSGPVLPEPVVASSSSSKTGSVMTDLRRTSASQYHLQQQLEATHIEHKAPV